jgi:Ser/Thr protein kinase RdoA (MazF antagonist)
MTLSSTLDDDETRHRDRIAAGLCSMELESAIRGYEVLQGGISGAATHRVHVAGRPVVLKIVEAGSPPELLERAEREMSFYRALSHRIPLRVPAMLGMSTQGSTYSLCLQGYRPVPAVVSWTERYYVEIAHELGRFHATFWNRTRLLSHFRWLRIHRWTCAPSLVQQAAASWRGAFQRHQNRDEVNPDELIWIDWALSHLEALDPIYDSLPATLLHGDCHHANLLLDYQGERVWSDWQEVGIGLGPQDLSFLFQRARVEGGMVPEDAAIEAYHQSLQSAVGQSVDLQSVRRVMDAFEFRTLLLLWPPFLARVSPQQLNAIVRRLHHLERRLGL